MALEGRIEVNVNGGMMGSPKTGAGMSGGGTGGMLGAIPGMGKALGLLGVIAGAITLLVKSSALLQGVLGGIGKLLMLIIRPLGDILGVALMPLLYIMKPIGIFFNTLMRPYLQKAMAAMKAGGALMKEGDVEGAMGAFALGGQYLLKPYFDMMVRGSEVIVSGLIDVADAMTGGMFHTGLMAVKEDVRSAGEAIISASTNFLDYQLGGVLAKAESTTGTSMTNIVKSLSDAEVSIGYLSAALLFNMKAPFENMDLYLNQDFGPKITADIKNIFESARKAQLYTPPPPPPITVIPKLETQPITVPVNVNVIKTDIGEAIQRATEESIKQIKYGNGITLPYTGGIPPSYIEDYISSRGIGNKP